MFLGKFEYGDELNDIVLKLNFKVSELFKMLEKYKNYLLYFKLENK